MAGQEIKIKIIITIKRKGILENLIIDSILTVFPQKCNDACQNKFAIHNGFAG